MNMRRKDHDYSSHSHFITTSTQEKPSAVFESFLNLPLPVALPKYL